jgi:flagellar biosynthesis/type III secretory pathway M-ring protein FliF/YscJ
MESWRRTLSQFRDLFNNMAPSQRMTLVVLPLLVLAGLGTVMYLGIGPAEEALMMGKVFSAEELKTAEGALRKGGLGQFRVDGQRIMVPKAEAARYNAALITGEGVPDRFGEEFEKALNRNPFLMSGETQRRDGMDFAKAMEVVNMIKAIPDIEDARLVANRSAKRGFGADSKVTATLSVKPRRGNELASELVQSLRQVVAGAFGMAAGDVTVVNTKTGIAPRLPEKNDPFNNGYVEAKRMLTSYYQKNIAEALKDIPNAIVAVEVDIENVAASTEQERKYDPKQFPYKTTEDTQKEDSSDTAPGSEPGVQANQPRNARPQTVSKNIRSREKTLVSTDSVPVGTKVTVSEKVGLTPKSVQASVAIPKDYYREVLLKQGVDQSDKAALQTKLQQLQVEKEKEVTQRVLRLIPPPAAGATTDVVTVSSYDSLETVESPAPVAMTTRVNDVLTQWGGPAGLALFALWALVMLNRSMKRSPELTTDVPRPAAAKAAAAAAAAQEEEEQISREPTKRDRLQLLVKDNPEMAATVISRWLAPPK